MNCLTVAWTAHEPELRGWLRHRLGNPAEADDLMQDLFLKALRQGERFCSVRNARAWLFEVARNTLADRLRVARETVELPEDLAAPSDEPDTVDTLTACLPRVLSELSAEDREAITLCDLQGMPQAEFARTRGLGLSGAKVAHTARPSAPARAYDPGLPGAAGRGWPCERLRVAPAYLK